jgi:hypothetical protein
MALEVDTSALLFSPRRRQIHLDTMSAERQKAPHGVVVGVKKYIEIGEIGRSGLRSSAGTTVRDRNVGPRCGMLTWSSFLIA